MACSASAGNASFAFALFSEVLLLTILALLVLHIFQVGRIPRALLGNLITFAAPLFLVFGIICIASLSDQCIKYVTGNDLPVLVESDVAGFSLQEGIRFVSRVNYGFEWGVLDFFLFLFFGILALVCVLTKKNSLIWKGDPAPAPAPQAPTTAPPAQQPYMQPQPQPYVQTPQPAPPPAYPQPPVAPQPAQPVQPVQYAPPPTTGA